MNSKYLLGRLIALTLIIQSCMSHMQMSQPFPIRSPLDPDISYLDKDYDYTSPILADGANFPCKGYQNDNNTHITATYQTGSTYKLSLQGTATHGGGSCQISLSYDNGKTFRVIKSIIGGCPLSLEYDFHIPSYAPVGSALLAWTWYNHVGNRELYMNCAAVSILDSSEKLRKRHNHHLPHQRFHHHFDRHIHNGFGQPNHHRSRRLALDRAPDFTSFDQLPYLWVANVPPVNDCETIAAIDPVFPHPGPDVVYGGGLNALSPSTSGSCDRPVPGPAYHAQGLVQNSASLGSSDATRPVMTILSSTLTSTPTTYALSNSRSYLLGASSIITMPALATVRTTSIKTTITPVKFSNTSRIFTHSTSHAIQPPVSSEPTQTSQPGLSTSRLPSQPSSSIVLPEQSALPFGNVADPLFLPCIPGTFLCSSSSTFLQCYVSSGDSTTAYVSMGGVAAGTICETYSSVNEINVTPPGISTGGGLSGTHRDDRILRASAIGYCATSQEGVMTCVRDGTAFAICTGGAWVDMGSVAQGTKCVGTFGQAAQIVRDK